MGAPIDLSTLKKNNQKPSLSDLSEEQQEALSKMAEGEELPKERVTAAFLVVIKDGHVQTTPDLSTASLIEPERVAHVDDISSAVAIMQRDIAAQMTAQHTTMAMTQFAQAQMQAAQNAAIAKGLNL